MGALSKTIRRPRRKYSDGYSCGDCALAFHCIGCWPDVVCDFCEKRMENSPTFGVCKHFVLNEENDVKNISEIRF